MAISRYTNPLGNTLEQYVPIPFQEMVNAGQMIQQRGDLAEQQAMQVETGLASLEARAPVYAQFRDKFVNDFKTQASSLLDKYKGNTSDPNFIRESKKLNLTFASDPRLQTIKQGNENIKRSQELEARMKAEGKLFISDLNSFKGIDETGKLSVYNGSPRQINTLDNWTNLIKAGAATEESIGDRITNKRGLQQAIKGISSDIQGQQEMRQAYLDQGLSPQQADIAVKSNLQRIISQFPIQDKANEQMLNRQQSAYQFNVTRNDRLNDQAADRANKLQIAQLKNKPGTASDGSALPSVRQNELGFSTGVNSESRQFVPTFGSSSINSPTPIGNGIQNFGGSGFYRQTNDASNKSYNGVLSKQTGGAKLNNGQFEGLHNVAVTTNGDVITSKTKGEFIERNGKTYYRYIGDDGKSLLREAKPQTMKVYTDKGTGSVYYAPANEQESMRYMGATGAYWEGRKTVGQQYGLKPNQSAPQGLKNFVQVFDFRDANTVATLESIGSSRGYDINTINKVFNKTAKGDKLTPSEALILDNIATDINNISKYNQFNKAEFDNQGKRSNINNSLLKQSNDNTMGGVSQDEAYQDYLKSQED